MWCFVFCIICSMIRKLIFLDFSQSCGYFLVFLDIILTSTFFHFTVMWLHSSKGNMHQEFNGCNAWECQQLFLQIIDLVCWLCPYLPSQWSRIKWNTLNFYWKTLMSIHSAINRLIFHKPFSVLFNCCLPKLYLCYTR